MTPDDIERELQVVWGADPALRRRVREWLEAREKAVLAQLASYQLSEVATLQAQLDARERDFEQLQRDFSAVSDREDEHEQEIERLKGENERLWKGLQQWQETSIEQGHEIDRLKEVLRVIRYEPIGRSDASHKDVLEAIERMAESALAPRPVAPKEAT